MYADRLMLKPEEAEDINKAMLEAVVINKAIPVAVTNKAQLLFIRLQEALSNTQLDLLKFKEVVNVEAELVVAQPAHPGLPVSPEREERMVFQERMDRMEMLELDKLAIMVVDKAVLSAHKGHKAQLADLEALDQPDHLEMMDNQEAQATEDNPVRQALPETQAPTETMEVPVSQASQARQELVHLHSRDQKDHRDQQEVQASPDSQVEAVEDHNQDPLAQPDQQEAQAPMASLANRDNLEMKELTEGILNIVHVPQEVEALKLAAEVNNKEANKADNPTIKEFKVDINKLVAIEDERSFNVVEPSFNVVELLLAVWLPFVAVLRHKHSKFVE